MSLSAMALQPTCGSYKLLTLVDSHYATAANTWNGDALHTDKPQLATDSLAPRNVALGLYRVPPNWFVD